MLAHAVNEAPAECCGLLAGPAGQGGEWRVTARFPLVNALASPTEYESEPRSMFEALRAIQRRSWDILAVYHSHPTSPPVPSRTDLERNYSEEVMNLIVSLQADPPKVRGWWLTPSQYRTADFQVVDQNPRD